MDWPDITQWGPNVVIVALFLGYLIRRDVAHAKQQRLWFEEAKDISDRCHSNHLEVGKALKELTTVIIRANGKGP